MIVKLLTEHHLEFKSLTGGCTGSSESTLVKLLEISCHGSCGSRAMSFFTACSISLVENQNDLELDFKVFFFVGALYLMNSSDATLASLSVLKYSRWHPRWPSVMLLRSI